MIPILYASGETSFSSNGLGRLTDCISCLVTEERNGIYELEFAYPITGRFYQTMIESGGVVSVIHDDNHDRQAFDIYKHSAPINGVVTFNAHHISYRLSKNPVRPFEAATCALALQAIKNNTMYPCQFSFWTDKNVSATMKVEYPHAARELLCGEAGSVLDVYGKGDYEFDNFTVKLHLNRGVNSGVTIRYGKNITDITKEKDESSVCTAIAPYWLGMDGEVVLLPEGYVIQQNIPTITEPWTVGTSTMTDGSGTDIDFNFTPVSAIPVDFSSDFEEMPTVEQLRARATAYLAANEPWIPYENISVNFVELWQTPEYANVAALQRVKLCDTVSIYFPDLGVTTSNGKVIRVVYDVLSEAYTEMELGKLQTTLADSVISSINLDDKADVSSVIAALNNLDAETQANMELLQTELMDAIDTATEAITGGLGGYVVLNANALGQPQEILIMDTPDINTAVNVWRWNKNGLGHSHNGYNGPFDDVAITQDGRINASLITAGQLTANLIKAGTISDALGKNYWNLNSGTFVTRKGTIATFTISESSLVSGSITPTKGGGLSIENSGITVVSNQNGLSDMSWMLHLSGGGLKFSSAPAGQTQWQQNGGILFSIHNGYPYVNFGIGNGSGFDLDQSATYPNGFMWIHKPVLMDSSLTVTGTKSRQTDAEEFGTKRLYAYETPTPYFGDIGSGKIDENGTCYVFLDPVFAETISGNEYQVFLQAHGQGECYVSERRGSHFVVSGTEGLEFGWEIKAKQKGYDQIRFDEPDFTPEQEGDND